jgi:hypothetical protein
LSVRRRRYAICSRSFEKLRYPDASTMLATAVEAALEISEQTENLSHLTPLRAWSLRPAAGTCSAGNGTLVDLVEPTDPLGQATKA